MAVLIGSFLNISQSSDPDWVDWVDIDNINDSTANSYGYVTMPVCITPEFSEDLLLENHTIDSTRSDYIKQVEIGITYGCDKDPIYLPEYQADDKYFVIIVSNDVEGITTEYTEIPLINDDYITHWIDITNLIFTPGFTDWEWSHIKDLEASCYVGSFDTTSGFIVKVYDIQIRVTTSDTPIPNIGLRCYDSTGNITISEYDSISRVLYQEEAEALTTDSKKIYKDYYTTIIAYAQVLESGKMPHILRRIGTGNDENGYYETWQWSPNQNNPTYLPPGNSLIIIMGY